MKFEIKQNPSFLIYGKIISIEKTIPRETKSVKNPSFRSFFWVSPLKNVIRKIKFKYSHNIIDSNFTFENHIFNKCLYIISCLNSNFLLFFSMKKILMMFLVLPSFIFANSFNTIPRLSNIKAQSFLSGRNMVTSIWNTGVFNQNLISELTPSFQWPANSGKFLGLSAGLCLGAYSNGVLKLANVTYNGEYTPGYVINGGGVPIPKTDVAYHIYKVSKGDNCANNPDFCNWSSMIDKGAPFDDININGIYDEGIDIPGVKNAEQTIFICITDGFAATHSISEGFSGGTAPLFAEVAFTSWIYDNPGYEDVQFMKYRFKNMSLVEWKKTYFSMFVHPQIGDSLDDYVGCDTLRRLGYAYNRDNEDGSGQGNTYGTAPPAVGMTLLNDNVGLGMTSFHYTIPQQVEPAPSCEEFPITPLEAYNLMRGYKKDNTPWLDATSLTTKTTKYTFPGDPETNTGWTEYNGVIGNCFGSMSGEVTPNFSRARTFLMSTGAENLNVNSTTFPVLYYAQLAARGTDNKNSVTRLKMLSDKAQQLFNNYFVIGINPISTTIPDNFSLYQNYPNPFNPETKIKFEIPQSDFVNLTVYDLNGRLIEELVNEKLSGGTYEVNFTAKNLTSGIYFYQINSTSFSQTKKMILVK